MSILDEPARASPVAPFRRVLVDHLVRGGGRVSWTIHPAFTDPVPWSFQLQAGSTGVPAADDWADVGLPAVDAFYAVDDERRLHGTNPTTHYRVALATPMGAYTSAPAPVYGPLGVKDWLFARALVRKERLRAARKVAVPGLLLKRRREGAGQDPARAADPAAMARDPATGGLMRRRGDAETLGTGFLGGYFRPMPLHVDLEPAIFAALNERADPARGNVDDEALVVPARIVLVPPLARGDVWIATGSDMRYTVHSIKVAAAWRGVPLIGDPVELRAMPLDDVIYGVDPAAL